MIADLKTNDIPRLQQQKLDASHFLLLTQSPRTRASILANNSNSNNINMNFNSNGSSGNQSILGQQPPHWNHFFNMGVEDPTESPPRSPKTMRNRSKLPLQCPGLVSLLAPVCVFVYLLLLWWWSAVRLLYSMSLFHSVLCIDMFMSVTLSVCVAAFKVHLWLNQSTVRSA